MDPSSSLDLASKDRIHHFFAFLPLLTMILLKVNIWILIIYTGFFAIWEVYIALLSSFKVLATKTTINPPKSKKKMHINQAFQFIKNKFWFINNLPLFVLTLVVVCISFITTLVLSVINIKEDYMLFIFLAHVFLSVFMIRILKTIKYLSSQKIVKEKFKNGK